MTTAPRAGRLGELLGEGREAQVYARDAATVVKLYRPGFRGHTNESLALTALDGTGVAPRLLDEIDYGGRAGLVLERLAGSAILTLVQRQPWRILSLARTMAAGQLLIHNVPAPAQLPGVHTVLAGRIRHAGISACLEEFVLGVLDKLPAGDRLCHGDYHPDNVLVDARAARVIDWSAAARGVPHADHARTMVLLRWAKPLAGTPWATRLLLTSGRRAFTRAYARAYRRGAPGSTNQIKQWLTVHAAARLSEGIATERTQLIQYLEHVRQMDAR